MGWAFWRVVTILFVNPANLTCSSGVAACGFGSPCFWGGGAAPFALAFFSPKETEHTGEPTSSASERAPNTREKEKEREREKERASGRESERERASDGRSGGRRRRRAEGDIVSVTVCDARLFFLSGPARGSSSRAAHLKPNRTRQQPSAVGCHCWLVQTMATKKSCLLVGGPDLDDDHAERRPR